MNFERPITHAEKVAENAEIAQDFSEVLPSFSETQKAYDSPRCALVTRKSIDLESLRNVARFGSESNVLEYVLVPGKNNAILSSGSRSSGNPFNPDEEERELPRIFPLSLILYPKRDPEMVKSARKFNEIISSQIEDAEWLAHWHPKGSANRATGNYPSGIDFITAAKMQRPNFMFDEESIFIYAANGKTVAEAEKLKEDLNTSEYIPQDIRYTNDAFNRSTKEFKQRFIEERGFTCVEISWSDPRALLVLSVIQGEKKWSDVQQQIFDSLSSSPSSGMQRKGN